LKNVLVWLAVIISLAILWRFFHKSRDVNFQEKDFTTFYQDLTAKRIKAVIITGEDLEGEDISNRKFKTVIPPESFAIIAKDLRDNGVAVTFRKSSNASSLYVCINSLL
jgi:ATP-dependent Zn protease